MNKKQADILLQLSKNTFIYKPSRSAFFFRHTVCILAICSAIHAVPATAQQDIPVTDSVRMQREAMLRAAQGLPPVPHAAASPLAQPNDAVKIQQDAMLRSAMGLKPVAPVTEPGTAAPETPQDRESAIMQGMEPSNTTPQTEPIAPALAPDAAKETANSEIEPPKTPPSREEMQVWASDFVSRMAGDNGLVSLDVQVSGLQPNITDPVGMDEAVAFALRNNYEVRAATAGLKSTYWDKIGAYMLYAPIVNLDLAAGYERSRPASYNNANGLREPDDGHTRRDRNLSVNQPLIDLVAVADILNSQTKEELAQIGFKDLQERIASETVDSYLSLIQSRISVQLADQYKAYLGDLAGRMQSRVDEGGAPKADLDRIITRETLAESARVEAIGDYEISLAEFKRLTGIMPIQIRVPAELAPDVPADAQSALQVAYKYNPEYLAGNERIDLARGDKRRSYAGLLPRLSTQYTSSYTYNAGGSAAGNPIDGVYPTQRTDSVMLIARWSLYGGTAVTSGLSSAEREKQLHLQSADIRERIEQATHSSYTALGAAERRQMVLREAVEANERVVAAFEEQYNQGTRPLFDLLDSYEQLYGARLNLMRVIFADARAAYQVHRQMGDVVPTLIKSEELK